MSVLLGGDAEGEFQGLEGGCFFSKGGVSSALDMVLEATEDDL